MTINLHLPAKAEILRPTITVIGVGGAGGNAVNNMIASNLEGVNFVVANTDAQALDHSLTERTIQLGAGITKGLGAGANPDVGRAAAEEARDEIAAYIEGSNMVFITAGMGGGTGTGAASVVARMAKDQGILTVAVVTKPFTFEGSHRMKLAEAGLKELQDYVDTLIIIPNQNLFRIANERTTFADAFKMADEVLHSGVRGVTDLMVKPGLINLDFADIRTVMREMGKAMMGVGEATGDRRAIESAEAAISNPLLDDVSLKGARALLINITGGPDMTLFEVDEAANRVREEVDADANIIFGSTFSDEMQGRMRVSVVATGIDAQQLSNHTPKYVPVSAEPRKPYSFSGAKQEAPRVQQAQQAQASQPAQPSRVANFEPVARETRDIPVRETASVARMAASAQEAVPMIRFESQHRAGGAVRIERMELPPVVQEQAAVHAQRYEEEMQEENSPASYEQAPEAFEQDLFGQRTPSRQPARGETSGRGFFQRMADVGRAFSGKPEAGERVQVVQRPALAEPSEKTSKAETGDQYLDIPAFLRRQAN